jgi:L-seryl-tRNA(Ser) seleniumtransferase
VLRSALGASLCARHPRWAVKAAVRGAIDALRERLRAGEDVAPVLDPAALEAAVVALRRPSLRRVINATGVVLHTNLGRAPLAPRAIAHLIEVARRYSNLEYDLERGSRGSRHDHLGPLLAELCGAEAACVVNNNAGAVLLALAALAGGREVIVSRGELVEIGGSFRVPDVMRASGALLCEVGTTNKTHPDDYRGAIGPQTALLLKVHRSNFALLGFTAEVGVRELAAIGRAAGLPVMMDLGSGCLVDLARGSGLRPGAGSAGSADLARGSGPRQGAGSAGSADLARSSGPRQGAGSAGSADLARGSGPRPGAGSAGSADLARDGLPPEPTVGAILADGADLVTFSGDKLLGGPQAGVLCGRAAVIDAVRRHPLMRALRPDKLTLAALEATLGLYRDGALDELPALAMLRVGLGPLRARAAALAAAIGRAAGPALAAEVVTLRSAVGGGALPLYEPESCAVALTSARHRAAALEARLRRGDPPVIGRIADDRLLLDVRTLDDAEVEEVARAAAAAAGEDPLEVDPRC